MSDMLKNIRTQNNKIKQRSHIARSWKQNYMHAEQWHSEPFQDWIKLLNWEKLFSLLKWYGRLFQSEAAANLKDFLP